MFINQGGKEPRLSKIDGPRHIDKISDRGFRVKGDVTGAEGGPHAVAEQTDLLCLGTLEELLHHDREDARYALVHGQAIVLLPEAPPVEEIEVEPLLYHVFDKATSGQQVEDIGAADPEVRDHENGDRIDCLRRRSISIQSCLSLPVDESPGRLYELA